MQLSIYSCSILCRIWRCKGYVPEQVGDIPILPQSRLLLLLFLFFFFFFFLLLWMLIIEGRGVLWMEKEGLKLTTIR